jgi:chlorite dismutase
MGQAKQRGTHAERVEEARKRVDDATVAMAEHLKKLDEIEAKFTKVMTETSTKMITYFITQQEAERKSRMGIRIGSGQAS